MSDDEKEKLRQLEEKVEEELAKTEKRVNEFRKFMKILRVIGLIYVFMVVAGLVMLILSLFFEGLATVSIVTLVLLNASTVVLLVFVHERNKKVLTSYPTKLKLLMWFAILLNMSLTANNLLKLI